MSDPGDEDVIARYYDADNPSPKDPHAADNFDAAAVATGVVHDVPWYVRHALAEGGPVLDLGCGTGRITLPLAGAGLDVTAVDASAPMLAALEEKLGLLDAPTRRRVRVVHGDIAEIELPPEAAAVALLPFSVLLCLPDRERQRRALRRVAQHLAPGGALALDVHNPLVVALEGDAVPRLCHVRVDPRTGAGYTRFVRFGPVDEAQRQVVEGWYDALGERRTFRYAWRFVHRFELELMLAEAGLEVESVEGGSLGEPYRIGSLRVFVVARRRGARAELLPTGSSTERPWGEASLEGLAATSLVNAAARAAETARPARLFSDPLARRLAGRRGPALLAELDGERGVAAIAVRTRWIDDHLAASLAAGTRVVVSLGAGLDTRPHRLSVPAGAVWIELDQEPVQAYKAALLADLPRAVVSLSGSAEDPALGARLSAAVTAAGGDPAAPRLVIAEGLLPYLDAATVDQVLAGIARMPAGSVALFDVPSTASLDPDRAAGDVVRGLVRHGAPWRFGTNAPVELAARHGLVATTTFLGAADAHFGRLATPPVEAGEAPPRRTFLVRAVVPD